MIAMPTPFAICIIAITVLAALGLPIGHSMIVASVLYLFLAGLDPGTVAEQLLNGLFNSYVLLAVPLFIFAADLMNIGSLTDRLLSFCLVLVGRFRGGLGHVNVVANMIFAGMSGSAVADLASVGKIGLKAMRDNKYPDDISAGVIISASTIGPIIPPSINMVIFGSIANVPIGLLVLGGVIPGVLTGFMLMLMFVFIFVFMFMFMIVCMRIRTS